MGVINGPFAEDRKPLLFSVPPCSLELKAARHDWTMGGLEGGALALQPKEPDAGPMYTGA